MAGGGGAEVRPPRPNCRQSDGSASQGRRMGDPLGAWGRVEGVEARWEGVGKEFGGSGVLAAERMVHDRLCSLEARMGGEGMTWWRPGDFRSRAEPAGAEARRRDARVGRVSPCSAAQGGWSFGPFPGRGARPKVGRRVHGTWFYSDGREGSLRRKAARTTRGQSRTGVHVRARRRRRRHPFYFLQHISKLQNSKFPNQSWKSPNMKVVEEV
jgi:hypothetical protein